MDLVDAIKNSVDIAGYISKYVKLTQRGRNNFGLCPFHNEKTPSFSVNTELQIFKCFGCGESGDIFSFVQKYHHMEFHEAIEHLAEFAGINPDDYQLQDKNYIQRKLLFELNNKVALFYNKILSTKYGISAKKYLHSRNINDDMINKFCIGYAPRGTKVLSSQLIKKYSSKDILNSGLIKDESMVDKFRDRIIFPIFDISDRVIGFTGRILNKDDNRPKYLNSPENIIFRKRYNLYGLNIAKKHIKEKNEVIVVEGTTDVINSNRVGVGNIVAPLGTSLTNEQLLLIKRFTNVVCFAFDNDTAGRNALIRSSNIAHELGLTVKAIIFKDFHDVDEMINKDPKKWIELSNKSENVLELILNHSDISTLEKRKKVSTLLIDMIKHISDPILKDYYVTLLASKLDINKDNILDLLKVEEKSMGDVIEEKIKINSEGKNLELYYFAILYQYKEYRNSTYLIPHEMISSVNRDFYENYFIKNDKSENHKDIITLISTYVINIDDLDKIRMELVYIIKQLKLRYYRDLLSRFSKNDDKLKEMNDIIKAISLLQKE